MTRRILLTARAIVTGVLATLLFRAVVIVPSVMAARVWGPRHWLARWLLASILPGLLPAAGAAFAGWVVARFHREHRVWMVASYAVFVLLMALPRAYSLGRSGFADPRFLVPLLNYLTNILVVAVGVLVGGLWFAAPDDGPRGVQLTAERSAEG